LGKGQVCAKWISHVLNDDQWVMRVFLATTHLLRFRNEDHAFLDRILTVDSSRCIRSALSWNVKMLNGVSKRHRGGKFRGPITMLWKLCTSLLQAKLTCSCPSRANWCDGQWPILVRTLTRDKQKFRVNDLNRKTTSTLLSQTLRIVWAKINTELQ
jgi:hypothetical protein